MTEEAAAKEPSLFLIRGEATAEEVAAVVAVLQASASAAAAAATEPVGTPVSSWAAPVRKLRATHPHGPGGWRASGLPR